MAITHIEADVLVIGGGMAAAWAAISAARTGASVTMVDKGYVGASGVTATAGPGHWFIEPGEAREEAIAKREAVAFGLAERRWMARILDETYRELPTLAPWYRFGTNEQGRILYGPVRGPEYMRALRARALALNVRILDHSPALELLRHGNGAIAGARGLHRQPMGEWTARAAGVVLATGGCAFHSRLLGSRTNTGDGYLMAAEAGAELSGMEFTSQYVIAPAFSTMGRSMSYAFASYYDENGRALDLPVMDEGCRTLARHLLAGPVYCDLARMPEDIRRRLPYISPNVMLPFVRRGIDPFKDRFPVTLLAEGTIRGMGGIKIIDDDCQTVVAGLYAAGDAASRELVTGATSGGGAINSAWALSSAIWSGRAAIRAERQGIGADRPAEPLGEAGLRPRVARRHLDTTTAMLTVNHEATHYDKNLFRSGEKLTASLAVLERLWTETRDFLASAPDSTLRAREAAALVASARLSYTAALHRRESRGQHQREDATATLPTFARRQTLSGLDRIASSFA